jgi:uncharacterized protein YecE (DUF72 family)
MARRLQRQEQLRLWSDASPDTGPIRVGTSGWHYAHWRGPFYPADLKPAAMLGYYSNRFDCVELNNSFYRLPSKQAFAQWRDATPQDFVFAVKASRFMTHVKKLDAARQTIGRLTAAAAGLGDKRGPVLFQLPPTWHVDVPRLRAFLDAWPRDWPSAWEFRDESWFCDAVYDALADHGAALCLHDLGGRRAPEVFTAALVYVRLHGPGRAYADSYPAVSLQAWADKLLHWAAEDATPWVFFNNDAQGHAPHDALRLRQLIRRQLGGAVAA